MMEETEPKDIKCPICGTLNSPDSEQCKLCMTRLGQDDEGRLKVSSPKSSGEIFTMIDIEDEATRKQLEELTIIPGVDRMRALYLYKSGITSVEEFLQKAFHGERFSENFARTVANKLLMQSLKGDEKGEARLLCPSCEAQNPADAEKCNVCGFEIEKEMAAVDLKDIQGQLSDTVKEVFEELAQDADFEALPEEMKAQFAMVLESDDVDLDMDASKELGTLGVDMDKLEVEISAEQIEKEELGDGDVEAGKEEFAFEEAEEEPSEVKPEAEPEETAEAGEGPEPEETEAVPEPDADQDSGTAGEGVEEPEPESESMEELGLESPEERVAEVQEREEGPETPETRADDSGMKKEASRKIAAQREKIRSALVTKLDQWRAAGYDVEGLDECLDDVETFKEKAKEALKRGKVVKKQCKKQLEMWKEKGFDVSELEPLLEKDVEEFKVEAKRLLKKQKG